MRIYMHTIAEDRPVQKIAAAALSIGTGKGVKSLNALSKLSDPEQPTQEAVDAFKDSCKGALSSVLEFASFNFFWEDVPIFLLRELIRHRVGVSYAEQSLRFAVMDESLVERFPREYAPSMTDDTWAGFQDAISQQLHDYHALLNLWVSVQDARNILGVWVPTHITTAFTYRALRDILALRQTSQAHPAWQDAVCQIKSLVGSIHSVLAEELRDICDISGRCVWQSKLDRPCSACEARGRVPNHVHEFKREREWEVCVCGTRRSVQGDGHESRSERSRSDG